jgi:uncharacterized membrane protein YdbT with pleckstrin-like domain
MEEKVYRKAKFGLYMTIGLDLFLCMFFVGFIFIPLHLLQYKNNFIILTGRGVSLRKGAVFTHTVEIPFSKINSVSVKKGFWGSIFGFGDIVITTGNDISGEVFKRIENPDQLKTEIMGNVS